MVIAAAQYRKSLDLMTTAAAPWAFVTLYYGCWQAARSILGMFGGTVLRQRVMSVDQSRPGTQRLRLVKIGTKPGEEYVTTSGTHEQFWEIFYNSISAVQPQLPRHLQHVVVPVRGINIWQAKQRNQINYDAYYTLQLSANFQSGFDKAMFPACLPGDLGTMFSLTEGYVELGFLVADGLGLITDALRQFQPYSRRKTFVRNLVYGERAPGLVSRTKKAVIV